LTAPLGLKFRRGLKSELRAGRGLIFARTGILNRAFSAREFFDPYPGALPQANMKGAIGAKFPGTWHIAIEGAMALGFRGPGTLRLKARFSSQPGANLHCIVAPKAPFHPSLGPTPQDLWNSRSQR
jgi:hypothetical protein